MPPLTRRVKGTVQAIDVVQKNRDSRGTPSDDSCIANYLR
jgi:hypothetical protein